MYGSVNSMSDEHSWIDTALRYAGAGWRLIPLHVEGRDGKCSCGDSSCSRPGAHPRFTDWPAESSGEERDILSWGDLWKENGIGLVTGRISGVIALAVDLLNDGARTLHALETRHERIELTPEYGVAGKSRYFLFHHPGGTIPEEIELGRGVRLLGDGTFAVVPPYLWWDRRSSLRWVEYPDQIDLRPAPSWLLQCCHIPTAVPSREDDPPASPCEAIGSLLPFRSGETYCMQGAAHASWILKPWIAEGALTLVTGAPKVSGKTTWLLNLARSILMGTPFLKESAAGSAVVYLTEQGVGSFNRALQNVGLTNRHVLQRLSVLHAGRTRGFDWAQLVRASADQCIRLGARVLMIDSLNRFSGLGSNVDDFAASNLIEPLQEAADRGLAVISVFHQFQVEDTGLSDSIHRLGKLAGAADIILSLRRPLDGRPTLRRIEILSRFEESQDTIVVDYDRGVYRNILLPLPLFDSSSGHDSRGDGFVDIPGTMIVN